MKRIKTGIPGLDKIIEGGFPLNSAILLVGPPGCGKTTMGQQFVYEGLKENQPAIYITLDMSPEEIVENMRGFGWGIKKEMIKFIDAYSWRVGKSEEKYSVSNLANINDLNILITDVINTLKKYPIKRNVFDSISTLLLYADPALAVKLIPVIIAKGRSAGFTQIFILEEGVHDEKTVTTLNYVADGLIEFKMEEDKRFLKVDRMKNTKHVRKWIEFDIMKKGIVIK